MNQGLDLYCERTGPEFWSEPLNAVTNAAFLLAAVFAFLAWRRRPVDVPVLLLIGLIAVIGIGSFLFHTYATRWAVIADTAPITLFIFGYFFLAMRRFFQLGLIVSFVLLAAFVAGSVASVPLLAIVFGGSAGYVPALVCLVVVGVLLLATNRPRGPGLLAAGGIFALSLGFRMLDAPVCAAFPLGSHFMWHILNALLLYVLAVTALTPRAGQSTDRA